MFLRIFILYLVKEWRTKDVCDWLDRGGFSQYKDNFVANHITGSNLFDLTEKDLNEELNIKDASHRKGIIQDLKFLKKIYSKNADEQEYIRNKLLRFYEKNQAEFFSKKNVDVSAELLNVGGVMVAPGGIASKFIIFSYIGICFSFL